MIESHVVSLDLARKLHELGVRKQSIFYWYDEDDRKNSYILVNKKDIGIDEIKDYPAYLASELLPFLPKKIQNNDCYERYLYIDTSLNYTLYYFEDVDNQEDENLANAIAKMLIYLIENGHVKVEDLNK